MNLKFIKVYDNNSNEKFININKITWIKQLKNCLYICSKSNGCSVPRGCSMPTSTTKVCKDSQSDYDNLKKLIDDNLIIKSH
jgi:hypothetical protein